MARNDHVAEPQLLRFCHPLLNAVYRADFSAEAHFAGHAPSRLYRGVYVARQHGRYYAQVHGQVGHAKASRNVEEDVFLGQLEPHALLEHGQEHVEPPLVEARRSALRGAVGCCRHQRLRLDEKRAHALDGRTDGYPAQAFMVLVEQKLRRVAHLAQSCLQHFVYSKLGSASEAVLYAAKYPVHVVLVAFKLYHRVYYVLQYLRAGKGSLLGDVAYEDDRDAARLCKTEQRRGTFAHLCDAAGA